MSTTLQDPLTAATPSAAHELAAHVMESDHKGAGIFFAKTGHGVTIQLGAVGIVVGLLSAGNLGLYSAAAAGIIAPVALSVGAIGVSVGGAWNIRCGNAIAGAIGSLYGVFFLSLALILILSAESLTKAAGVVGFGDALGTYFLLWAVISAGLTLATAFVNKTILMHQAGVTLTFLLLAASYLSAPNGTTWTHLAGVAGLIVTLLSFYIATAFVVNETADREILPLR